MNIELKEYLIKNEKSSLLFNKLKNIKNKNYRIINPSKLFCNNNVCEFNNYKKLFFFDEIHPSLTGSKMISNFIFENIF